MEIIKNAISVLKKRKDVDDWKIIQKISNKHNIYISKDSIIENYAEGERTDTFLTVYTRNKKNNTIGDSTIPLIAADANHINKKIDEALFAAKLVKNPTFDLPTEKRSAPNIKLVDPELKKNTKNKLMKLAEDIRKEVAKQNQNSNIQLAAAELLTNVNQVSFANSRGIRHTVEGSDIYFEIVLIAKKGKLEQEQITMRKYRRLKDLDVKKIIKEYSQLVNDVLKSEEARPYSGPVIITKDALQEFIAPELDLCPIVLHNSARLKYINASRYELNKSIINASEVKGDKLTITNNPLVPHNISSQSFDEDGIIAKKTILIQNNICKNLFANKRYSDYLNIPPTGPLGVTEIKAGKTSAKGLLKSTATNPVYEIVSLASFMPDSLSGNFTTEIRLGYLHKGNKKIPIKGGMFTGNVFELIKNMRLSKETIQLPGYHGPASIRFEHGEISGN